MSAMKPEAIVSRLYTLTGAEDRDSLHTMSEGSGTKSESALSTLAQARATIAESLPVAMAESLAARLEGTPLRATSLHLFGTEASKDTVSKYSIGAVLVGHGQTPEEARALVESATKRKVSKRDQWDAALEGVRAFRALIPADAPATEDKGTDTGRGGASDSTEDPTEGAQGDKVQTPEDRGHALVVAITGPLAALVKALADGSATLSDADKGALRTALAGAGQAAGVLRVAKPKPAAQVDAERDMAASA
jgi:hypothetical protein